MQYYNVYIMKDHGLRWIANFKDIFEEAEIQTWGSNGWQRYWIIAQGGRQLEEGRCTRCRLPAAICARCSGIRARNGRSRGRGISRRSRDEVSAGGQRDGCQEEEVLNQRWYR
jgi:hypothetical protein